MKRERFSAAAAAIAEVDEYFVSPRPDEKTLSDHSGQGAALVLKHIAQHQHDLISHAHILHTAMSAILNKSQKQKRTLGLLGKKSVSSDALIAKVHDAIVAGSPEKQRNTIEVLTTGAIGKLLFAMIPSEQDTC
jgi:hypothetical protein